MHTPALRPSSTPIPAPRKQSRLLVHACDLPHHHLISKGPEHHHPELHTVMSPPVAAAGAEGVAEGRGWDRGGGSRPMVKPALQSVACMCACTPGLHNTQDSCGLNQWHLTQRHCFAHAHAIPVRCMLLPSRAHPHNNNTTSTKQPLNLPPVIHVAAIHLQNVIEGDDQAQPRHYLHTHAPLQMSLWGGLSCL